MSAGKLQLVRPRARLSIDASHAGPGETREQVAAVCYRVRNGRVEFLLVRTRGGRWTFPKGGAKLSLTRAQSAALEAFEEAGVHGAIEEAAFAQYSLRKGSKQGRTASETIVHAYLCEVSELETPQEDDRHPSWFSAEKTKERLQEDRSRENGSAFVRVVDRATARIMRLNSRNRSAIDELQRVHVESSEIGVRVLMERAAYVRYLRRSSATGEIAGGRRKLLRLGPPKEPVR